MRLIRKTILVPVAILCIAAYLIQPKADTAVSRNNLPIIRGGDAWRGTSTRTRLPAVEGRSASLGGVLIDRVTRVRDGDTIVVGLVPIRLANLDCAEKGTVAGDKATARLRDLVADVQVTCRLEGRKSYDREFGRCALPDGQDLGEVLVEKGECRRWR